MVFAIVPNSTATGSSKASHDPRDRFSVAMQRATGSKGEDCGEEGDGGEEEEEAPVSAPLFRVFGFVLHGRPSAT